jgi:hypothetical protein
MNMREKDITSRATRQGAPRDGAARLAGGAEQKALGNAFVIKATDTRYGPHQRWGQREYAQAAIVALFPGGEVPRNVSPSVLTRRVKHHLALDAEYRAAGFKQISRQTVIRALEALRAANS